MKTNLTTLCYITRNNKEETLFIVKNRESDPNNGKWLGIGGHFEYGESEYDCMIRELREETGIDACDLSRLDYRGIITFVSDIYGTEYMHVFSAELNNPDKKLSLCDEGELVWYQTKDIYNLPIWEGDKIMFKALEEQEKFFSYKFEYEGEKLVKTTHNYS